MHGQRNGSPLILLNPAVIVGFQHTKLIRLIQGDRLQVDPRTVYMCRSDTHTVFVPCLPITARQMAFPDCCSKPYPRPDISAQRQKA